MDLSALKTELNLRTGDTDNFAFTDAEKESAVKEAIKDPYSISTVQDETLTFATATYQYAIPTAIDSVSDIAIKASTNENPQPIGQSLWSVVGANIQFSRDARYQIPDQTTLYVIGNKRYETTDTITDVSVQEYVLTLAQLKLYRTLTHKKLLKFVKNDTSVNEILNAKRDLEAEVIRARQRLQRRFEGA